jgi:hypothetical protein
VNTWVNDPIERAFRYALASSDMTGVRDALLAAERRDHSHAAESPALHLIEWEHPRLGRLGEVACSSHADRILASLDFLGIGGVGRLAPAGMTCLRCRWGGQPYNFLRLAVIADTEETQP